MNDFHWPLEVKSPFKTEKRPNPFYKYRKLALDTNTTIHTDTSMQGALTLSVGEFASDVDFVDIPTLLDNIILKRTSLENSLEQAKNALNLLESATRRLEDLRAAYTAQEVDTIAEIK